MSDITINYKGSSIATMDASGTKTLLTEGKYCEDDIDVVYTKPSVIPSNWTLIDTKTIALQEYTSTTVEETDTGIDVSALDYAFLAVVVTCDTAISSSSEWGMTVALLGRYISTGRVSQIGCAQQVGTATLSYASLSASTTNITNAGLYIGTNKAHVDLERKCNGNFTKFRGGNYKVSLYGLASL